MKNVVLRTNAIPLYGFLSFITNRQSQDEKSSHRKILDCGAGGLVPPLALFSQHGFDGWGIDTSEEQLDRASQFCKEQGIELHLSTGDMRRIPFEDETFDYVYEHYSMCHLSKQDTALAVSEMFRVLKKRGLCYLGIVSEDSWPKSSYGRERDPGEYWEGDEGDEKLHSMFTDQEADELLSAWEMVSKEKRVYYLREAAMQISLEDWMKLYEEAGEECTQDDWKEKYKNRINTFLYVHQHYVLEKS